MVRLAALLAAAVLAGMLVIELTMRPASSDRTVFGAALLTAAAFGFVSTPIIAAISRRASRFRTSLALVSVTGLIAAVVLMAVASAGMYASDHDLRLTIVALGVGVLLVVAQQQVIADVLSRDLIRMDEAVERLAAGDLSSTTGVSRRDELGGAAASIDLLAARLREAERLAEANEVARRELFANIGHDLQTPLASMRVAIEALEDGLARDPAAYLSSIGAEVMHVSRLVDDLFLVARLDAEAVKLETEPVDLRELVDATFEALRPLADQHGVRLEMDDAVSVVAVVDAAELSRCLRNLVDNAVRHAAGRVWVDVRLEGTTAVVAVADDGPGFGDVADQALDRFVRGSESRHRDGAGAGLGLAICRGLVEAHQGTITIGASPVGGGCVTIRIPLGRRSS
ncbi:MAG: ATP-binding protein [Acidimicrobiales bacterium]